MSHWNGRMVTISILFRCFIHQRTLWRSPVSLRFKSLLGYSGDYLTLLRLQCEKSKHSHIQSFFFLPTCPMNCHFPIFHSASECVGGPLSPFSLKFPLFVCVCAYGMCVCVRVLVKSRLHVAHFKALVSLWFCLISCVFHDIHQKSLTLQRVVLNKRSQVRTAATRTWPLCVWTGQTSALGLSLYEEKTVMGVKMLFFP